MYVKRNISFNLWLRYAAPIIAYATLWNVFIFSLFYFLNWTSLKIPFEPISVVGIAVSFFIGFKNNQSYDRFWEGRKIWGAIVNYSRTWGNQVLSLVTLEEATGLTKEELQRHQKDLIYRHVAWLHALRIQLRKPVAFSFEENALVKDFLNSHRENEPICEIIAPYLAREEVEDLRSRKNIATHIVKNQGAHLKLLKEKYQTMDGFDLMMMMKCLEECYNFQGKCERIKNTPFPRQYAFFSKVFAYIFAFLLPFGLLDIFLGEILNEQDPVSGTYVWVMVPLSVLITWIFLTWENIGDNSEDPFENKPNDVPMTGLTRTIEIDLRDMLNEKDLPEPLQPKDHILY